MHNDLNTNQFIVFGVSNHLLALPIADIVQVVNFPPQSDEELNHAGLIRLGNHIIRLVDLHWLDNSGDGFQPSAPPPFLVITKGLQGGFCGIPVYEPPDLIEISPGTIQILPQSERQIGVLKIASHAAVISWQNVTKTIFLLDIPRMVTIAPPDPNLLPSKFMS